MTFWRALTLGAVAISVLGGCASSKPTAPTAYDFVLADAQRREQTLAAAEPTVASESSRAKTRIDVAVVQYEAGNYDRASAAADEALAFDSQNAAAWLMSALSKEKLNQPHSVILHLYEKAHTQFPLNPDIQHNFGLFLCQQPETRERGFGLLNTAGQNSLNRGQPRTFLASAKCAPTQTAGIEFARKALDTLPQWADAWLVLGELYARESRWDAAHYALGKYFSFSESPNVNALQLGIRVADARRDTFQAQQYRERLKQVSPHRTYVPTP